MITSPSVATTVATSQKWQMTSSVWNQPINQYQSQSQPINQKMRSHSQLIDLQYEPDNQSTNRSTGDQSIDNPSRLIWIGKRMNQSIDQSINWFLWFERIFCPSLPSPAVMIRAFLAISSAWLIGWSTNHQSVNKSQPSFYQSISINYWLINRSINQHTTYQSTDQSTINDKYCKWVFWQCIWLIDWSELFHYDHLVINLL